MGKSGGTCRLMMQGISPCDHVTERDATGELAFYWVVNVRRIFYGAPKSKPRLCLFAFGRAEVRVAFNDRAERYHSRNLVTERSVIGQYDLIVERAVTERSVIGQYDLIVERAVTERSVIGQCDLIVKRAVVERASYSSHISLISQFSTTLFAHLQKNAYLCAFQFN